MYMVNGSTKNWARSGQLFSRLLDTNKQTTKQTDKQRIYICVDIGWSGRVWYTKEFFVFSSLFYAKIHLTLILLNRSQWSISCMLCRKIWWDKLPINYLYNFNPIFYHSSNGLENKRINECSVLHIVASFPTVWITVRQIDVGRLFAETKLWRCKTILQRNWAFDTNSHFPIPSSLQPDGEQF